MIDQPASPPTMTVIVDGKKQQRAIDYMEPNEVGFMEPVPVLNDRERTMRTVTGDIHIYKV